MTEEAQLKELLEDRHWRLNNLYWIEDKMGNLTRFRMNFAQEDLFKDIWYRNNILKARQLGMSTFTSLLILDSCLFVDRFRAGIIDKTLPDAQQKLGKIELAYEMLDYLPDDADERDKSLATIGREIKNLKRIESSSKTEITFINGSSVRVGTSMRGGTLQFLHVSELGSVAAHNPIKAREILTGAINAVSKDNIIIMESTHEGGKCGLNFELTRKAMDMAGKDLTHLDYRFFFYPWWKNKEYRIEGVKLNQSEAQAVYFASLASEGIILDDAQKVWYLSMGRTMGYSMKQEYPSTPSEAFDVQAEGAIYGQTIDKLREQGRLNCRFEVDGISPLYVSFDLGMADSTSMWAFQEFRTEHRVLDHYQANGKGFDFYVARLREWESIYGKIQAVFLPHDGVRRNWKDGESYDDFLRKAGFNVIIVPRTPDVWVGIDKTRAFLRDCVFHERCDQPIDVEGTEYISGLNALKNYRTAPMGQNGVLREMPLHDICSHSADAFRTFAEAHSRQLVTPDVYGMRGKPSRSIGVFRR